MKRKLRQLLSLALVVLMLLSVAPVTTFALQEEVYDYSIEGDTAYYNADDVPDYQRFRFFSLRKTEFDGCFGNQLDTESKRLYDAIVENYVTNRNYGSFIRNLSADFCYVLQYSKEKGDYINLDELYDIYYPEICSVVFGAYDAFLKDYPEIFWLRSSSFSTGFKTTANVVQERDPNVDLVDVTVYATVTLNPNEIYTDAHNDIEDFNNSVDAVVNELAAYFDSLGPEITRETMLRKMHNYIASNSDYDHESLSDPTDLAAHSAQPFFIGDKLHVCEGYAKVLKVLCDRFDIPCVLISGKTKDHTDPDNRALDGAHMWNYVQMEDGRWYLIDITWDDQKTRVYDTYFIANQNTKGFYFDTIAEERYETYTFSRYTANDEEVVGKEFVYPEFSSEAFEGHTHAWYEAEVITAPTHTDDGEALLKCESIYCTRTNTETLPADENAHSYTSVITTPATHLKEGVMTFSCECGDEYTEAIAKLTEHTFTAKITTPATHLKEGVETFTCACGETYTKPVAKLTAHTYTSVITTPATHLKEGVETFTCACGETYTKPVAKLLEHTFTSEITTPATHLEEGEMTFTCACGYSYMEEIAKLPGHTYTSEITTPATHLAEGVKTFSCECGDTYTEPVEKLTAHTYTSEITTAATHLTEGVETFTCACGDSYTKPVAKLTAHTYTSEITTAATHLKEGVETFTCACGDSYTKPVAKLPEHTYTSKITTAATHLTEGVETFTCACGDSYTKAVAKLPDHTYSSVVTTDPTCTTDGYTTYTCDCGYSYKADYVTAEGHDYESEITTPATHLKEGVETFTCACGDSYTKAVAKLPDHTYSSVVTTDPTCTADGYTTYTCECGYSYKDNYAGKLPHTEIIIPGTDSTCTAAGKTEGKKCSVCGTITVEPTVKPLLSHNYTASSAVDATCTEDGYTTYTCTECSASYKDNYVKASGHNYEEGTCTKCGESKADNCSHMCHKNNFIWKLLKFFFKLFKIQPVCECGVKHY